jgi:SAM-dependent methyltransferase
VQILDIACGECREAPTLVQTVQELAAERSVAGLQAPEILPVRFLGTDLRDREVEMAAERFKSTEGADFEFLVEDASKLDRNREIGGDFDLAFLRHQNFWLDRRIWRRIFAQGLAKLSPDGHLVITSYFDREHQLAIAAMKEVGAELVYTERNLETIELAVPGKSVDRHIAVFRRKSHVS